MAVYRLMFSNATDDDAFSVDSNNTDISGPGPGVTAGIAVGSVAGFGLLVFFVFLGARWLGRRRQARLRDISSSATTTSIDKAATTSMAAAQEDEKSIIGHNATRTDLRGLDSVVMDQQQHTAPRIGVTAATTGAEWRNNSRSSPLTPRTPRHLDILGSVEEEEVGGFGWGVGDGPTTPSIRVHPPENIAPARGLGERAWHRRRLSMPFPPAGEGVTQGGGKEKDDRRGLASQSSMAGSFGTEEDEMEESLSWRWTMSTEDSGSAGGEGMGVAGEKAGKKE